MSPRYPKGRERQAMGQLCVPGDRASKGMGAERQGSSHDTGQVLPTPMHFCHAHTGTIPVKHTGHLKVPPMPSKLCSMRWQRSLAGESNIWLHSLHSWLMPSSAKKSDNFSEAHTGTTRGNIPCTSPGTPHTIPRISHTSCKSPCTRSLLTTGIEADAGNHSHQSYLCSGWSSPDPCSSQVWV